MECTKLKSFNFVTNTTTKLFAPLVEYSRHGVPAYLSHNFYVSKFLEIVFFYSIQENFFYLIFNRI